jgi:hypothetical protein
MNADNVLIAPQSMKFVDSNTIEVKFSSPMAGRARLAGKTVAFYPAVSGSGSVDMGAVDEVKRFQDSISINNGLGGLVGVLGFESTAVPFEYHTIADAQDTTSFTYLTNQVGYNGTKIDVGTAISRANSTVPTRSMNIDDIRLGSHVNTSATDYLTGKVWFTGNSGDKIWVTAKTFNGVGGAYSVTVVVGPSATFGESYVIVGSATGTTGATQILSVTRLGNLTESGGGGGGGDPYWADVSFLLETTGTNTQNNNVFLDSSTNNATVTASGSFTQGSFSPFTVANGASYSTATGGGSAYFSGVAPGQTMVIANSPSLNILSGDFTIETWFKPSDNNGIKSIITQWQQISGLGGYAVIQNNATMQFYFGPVSDTSPILSSSTAIDINVWNHIAVVRSGSSFRMWLNGTSVATYTSAATMPAINISTSLGNFYNQYGTLQANGVSSLTGYLSSTRIVKDTAVYNPSNSTITVPTAPLTAITNTSLLLNFTNAGIYDATTKANLVALSDTQVSTTQAKFGTTSIKFDGTSDNLNFGTTTLGGDFTMECWFYQTAKSANYVPIISGTTGTYNFPLILDYQGSGKIGYYLTSGQNAATASSVFSLNTWTYLTMVRSGSTITVYLNGTSILTASGVSTSIMVDTAGGWSAASEYLFNGYMQDVRITKGVARYTADFTPPAAPFPTN